MNYGFENPEEEIDYKFRRCADQAAYRQDRNAGTESPKPSKSRPRRLPRTHIDDLTDRIEPLGADSHIFKRRFLRSLVLSAMTKLPEASAQIVHDHTMDKLQLCAERTVEEQIGTPYNHLTN